jgi:hypothetical protein
MTTLTLPNEILNKIFSYIEGKHNQIIKKELIGLVSFWNNYAISSHNITFKLDLIDYLFNILSWKSPLKSQIQNKMFSYFHIQMFITQLSIKKE